MSTSGTNGEHRATIREIASAAGVSIATVSRVLNERPGVAEETRGAVLRVVRDRGFTANRSARALSGGRTGLIGVMLPIVEATYFTSILSGAAEALYEQDMRMVLCPTLHHHEREVTLLDRLMHGTTDGAVLMLPEESNSELKILRRKGYAFVIVDPRVALDEGIPAVSAANASGARAATEHLLVARPPAHRCDHRAAAVPGEHRAPERLPRRHGGGRRPARSRAHPRVELRRSRAVRWPPGGCSTSPTRRPRSSPSTTTPRSARCASRASAGLRVPEDISVVGFDDSEQSAIVYPSLTTVRQPLAEMGRMAVSLLLRLLDNQRLEALHIELKTRLVVRESTARART